MVLYCREQACLFSSLAVTNPTGVKKGSIDGKKEWKYIFKTKMGLIIVIIVVHSFTYGLGVKCVSPQRFVASTVVDTGCFSDVVASLPAHPATLSAQESNIWLKWGYYC